MRATFGVLTVALVVLAGCAAPVATHAGPCTPAEPLLVVSGVANQPGPAPSESWTVVWPDGGVQTWSMRVTVAYGSEDASRVTARGGLEATSVCGVAAFHGSYPGPAWPPPGFPAEAWRATVDATPRGVAQGNASHLQALLHRSFFALPADASVPGCHDGVTLRYSASNAGTVHRVRAYCQGDPAFETFAEDVRTWLDEALGRDVRPQGST